MKQESLSDLIADSMNQADQLSNYSQYPPVYNSRKMLVQINNIYEKNNIMGVNIDSINIGMLSAKDLDFDEKFYDYALSLHNLWVEFLKFFGKQQKKLTPKMQLAYNFYTKHGFIHNQVINHLKGIDFNEPIDDHFLLATNTSVSQWKALCVPKGNYYADRNSSPNCLGIYDKQEDYLGKVSSRIEHRFNLKQKVVTLKSTAAAVLDTWSVKGKSHQTAGGCIQYFNSKDKNIFCQTYP